MKIGDKIWVVIVGSHLLLHIKELIVINFNDEKVVCLEQDINFDQTTYVLDLERLFIGPEDAQECVRLIEEAQQKQLEDSKVFFHHEFAKERRKT